MLLENIMQCFLHNFSLTVNLEQMFRDIQIVIITNFVVVSSVCIKRVNCIVQNYIVVMLL